MSDNNVVSADGLSAALSKIIEDYKDDVEKETKKAVDASARKAVSYLKTNSPKKTGKYAADWASKQDKTGFGDYSRIIYNKKRYMLTHLLELGHHNVRTGRRTKGIPHIEPAYQVAAREIERRLKG